MLQINFKLSFFVLLSLLPLLTRSSTSVDPTPTPQKTIDITDNTPVYYVTKDGKYREQKFSIDPEKIYFKIVYDNLKDTNYSCKLKIYHYNCLDNNSIRFAIKSNDNSSGSVQKGETGYNYDSMYLYLYTKNIVDPSPQNNLCDRLQQFDCKGAANIKAALENPSEDILKIIKKELMDEGLGLIGYQYPFEEFTPGMVREIINSESKKFIETDKEAFSVFESSNIDFEDEHKIKTNNSTDKIYIWIDKLIKFCKNYEIHKGNID